MGKYLNLGALLLGSALAFGCSSQNSGVTALDISGGHSGYVQSNGQTIAENDPASAKMLVKKAKSAIGTPYVMGGSAPGGFDCSGLVQWTYNSLGVNLPRTAREQASVGQKVHDVKDMREGDIVAFRHPKRGYHTGIYVGDGKFVHSPRKRSSVRINSLSDPYFRTTLLGARRVDLSDSENMIASSSGSLGSLVAEKSRLALSSSSADKIKASKKQPSAAGRAAAKAKATAQKSKGKKSTIATQARKIQSVKSVTGKSPNAKNSGAHAKLAKASQKATSKTADNKKTARKSTVAAKKTSAKTVSMLNKKQSAPAKRRSNS